VSGAPLHLFEGYGLETECMIVDRASLDVRPFADEVLRAACGGEIGDHDEGRIGWSNELVLHALELKTSRPVPTLVGLADDYLASIRRIDELLSPFHARLLPGAMHPWMDPRQARLWPHEYHEVYELYDRLFDCRRHGWANVQSTQLNLPFWGDEEFGRLHAAVRLVLPLLPAIAAGSPIVDGRPTGVLDTRIRFYRRISERVPEIAGRTIPEPVFDPAAYRAEILEPIYRAIAPLEPTGVLRDEWLNARGAIARFDRSAIEIRLVDAQECLPADLAIAFAVARAVEALVRERWAPYEAQKTWAIEPLDALLEATTVAGPDAVVEPDYARVFGLPGRGRATAGELWRHLVECTVEPHPEAPEFLPALRTIAERGTLAQRLLAATGPSPSRSDLNRVWADLAACLETGEVFRP